MKPRIFIGSSTEGRDVAYHLQTLLEKVAEVTVWDQGVFASSSYVLDSLVEELNNTDFCIMIFHPDDDLRSRGVKKKAVRDNIIFELGLAMGMLGRDRSIVVHPGGVKNLAIPTDLLGLTFLIYQSDRADGRISAALGPVASKIKAQIDRLGCREERTVDKMALSGIIKTKKALHQGEIEKLKKAITKASSELCVAIFDIDNFYGMNLVYGADICNEIIKTISSVLSNQGPYHIGGDRFAVICRNAHIYTLQEKIQNFRWETIRSKLYVTCSVGYSTIMQKKQTEDTIVRALQGLKMAKKEGKNVIREGPLFVDEKLDYDRWDT